MHTVEERSEVRGSRITRGIRVLDLSRQEVLSRRVLYDFGTRVYGE